MPTNFLGQQGTIYLYGAYGN